MKKITSMKDYLKKSIYKQAKVLGFTELESDVMIMIAKYTLETLHMTPEQVSELPLNEKMSVVFSGKREDVLNIYYSVYQNYNIPFTRETVPYDKEFEAIECLGDMIDDICKKVTKYHKLQQ